MLYTGIGVCGLRGGSWGLNDTSDFACAFRGWIISDYRVKVGIRLARSYEQ